MNPKTQRLVRLRPTRLREADEALAAAEEHRGHARHFQAAKQYHHAAELYCLCGLGLLARRAYAAAAAAYEHVEEVESSERCALHVKALPIYWDETHHDAKWG